MPPKKAISVVERRLKSGRIFGLGSQPIPLTEPRRWTLRTVNTQISDARLYEMQAEKGWTYVTAEDLAVKPEEVGFREQDGRIVRGTHGHEVLMKMPLKDFKAIQVMKDQENRRNTFGAKAVKSAITTAAAQSVDQGGLGSDGRAADFLDRVEVNVKDSLERVSLEE